MKNKNAGSKKEKRDNFVVGGLRKKKSSRSARTTLRKSRTAGGKVRETGGGSAFREKNCDFLDATETVRAGRPLKVPGSGRGGGLNINPPYRGGKKNSSESEPVLGENI